MIFLKPFKNGTKNGYIENRLKKAFCPRQKSRGLFDGRDRVVVSVQTLEYLRNLRLEFHEIWSVVFLGY